MKIKVVYINRCSMCPFFEIDPNGVRKFWGKNVCTHNTKNFREIENVKTIPDWCELNDMEKIDD